MSIRRGRWYDIQAWDVLGRIKVRIGTLEVTLSVEEATDLQRQVETAVRASVESEARIRAGYVAARRRDNE